LFKNAPRTTQITEVPAFIYVPTSTGTNVSASTPDFTFHNSHIRLHLRLRLPRHQRIVNLKINVQRILRSEFASAVGVISTALLTSGV